VYDFRPVDVLTCELDGRTNKRREVPHDNDRCRTSERNHEPGVSCPIRKVQAGTLAGALSAVLVWVLTTYWKVPVSADLAVALTTILTALVAYFTPRAAQDVATAQS
jgi:hypothetical protein